MEIDESCVQQKPTIVCVYSWCILQLMQFMILEFYVSKIDDVEYTCVWGKSK